MQTPWMPDALDAVVTVPTTWMPPAPVPSQLAALRRRSSRHARRESARAPVPGAPASA